MPAHPAARPSMPSVRLTALLVAEMYRKAIITKTELASGRPCL